MHSKSDWLANLLASLQRAGPEGEAAARYIRQKHVRLGVHTQPTGARWRLGNRIDLHPRYLDDAAQAAYPLSLVIHEVRHLQQGPLEALSVHGELEAWQVQFAFIRRRTGRYHDLPEKDRTIGQIMSLALSWDRSVLGNARRLMREYAGPKYRVDLLPLFPIQREIVWALTRSHRWTAR